MDLMEIRRAMMGVIAGLAKEEFVTIPANSIGNTTDMDTLLRNVVDGWDTEFIMLLRKSGTVQDYALAACFSEYAITNSAQLGQVWRLGTDGSLRSTASRNGYILKITEGDVFQVIRNPFTVNFS